jgi:hypothetical protein
MCLYISEAFLHNRGWEQDPEIRSPGLRTRRIAAIESGLRVHVGRALVFVFFCFDEIHQDGMKWYDRGEVIRKKGPEAQVRSEGPSTQHTFVALESSLVFLYTVCGCEDLQAASKSLIMPFRSVNEQINYVTKGRSVINTGI